MSLKNKTVLITGAAKRLGKAIALAFANEHCKLLLHYNQSENEAIELFNQLKRSNIESHLFQADLSKEEGVQKLIKQVLSESHQPEIIINNASIFYSTPVFEVSINHWNEFMGIHVFAPFFLAQAFAPRMIQNKFGRIINVSDWSANHPHANYLPYCSSKAALLSMTQSMAKNFSPHVLVNAICPGPILASPDLEVQQSQYVKQKTLVEHWGNPEEVASAAVFLAKSDFITGQSWALDGGRKD